MTSDSNPFDVIQALIKAGLIVEVGKDGVSARTEDSDLVFTWFGSPTEYALSRVVQQAYAHFSAAAEVLRPFGEMTSGDTGNE